MFLMIFAAMIAGGSPGMLPGVLVGNGSSSSTTIDATISPPQPSSSSTITLPAPPYDPYALVYRYNGRLAIVVVVIIIVFLFLSFFLFYIRHGRTMEERRRSSYLREQTQPQEAAPSGLHGLDRKMVENLAVMRWSAEYGNAWRGSVECSVCLTEFEDDEKLRILPNCGHCFHLDCIDMWLIYHSTCPVCRIRMVASDCDQITIAATASTA